MSIDGIFPIGLETAVKSPAEVYPILENILYFDKWGNDQMAPQTKVAEESL